MPKPKPHESKPNYIIRAIRELEEEGYPHKQAIAIAHRYWDTYHKPYKTSHKK